MRRIIILIIAASLSACNNMQTPFSTSGFGVVVEVDLDDVKNVNINDGEIIELEATDKSLLAYVNDLIIDDDKIFIISRSEVFAFDKSGHYLFNVGTRGRAENEYMQADCIFMMGDSLAVFDWQSHRLLFYNTDGEYLSDRSIDKSEDGLTVSKIFPLSSDGYIVENVFQGLPGETPMFGRLNEDFGYEYSYSGLYRQDGAFYGNLSVGTANTLLYGGLFSDSVYRAAPDNKAIEFAYYIDFGKYKFPESLKRGKENYQLIQMLNDDETLTEKFVTFLMYRNETKDKFRFLFGFRKAAHYVEYDRESGDVKTIKIEDPNGKLKPQTELFAHYMEDGFYILAKSDDIDSNPVLVRFGYDVFE